ncbi:hypothetical protein MTO96_011467 [Rhipicephalus appendiculatus]
MAKGYGGQVHPRVLQETKESICGSRFYDSGIGSSLLFEARAGALRTLEYSRKLDDAVRVASSHPNAVVSSLCRVCGVEIETQEHLVIRCRSLPTAPLEGATLPQALGFELELLDEEGSSDNGRYAVAVTNRRLSEWWATIRRA